MSFWEIRNQVLLSVRRLFISSGTLISDFYRLRFGRIARQHHCLSAKLALEAGHDEKVIVACFLHDISNGALVRTERLQGKGHVVRRMFADVEADLYVLVDGDDTYDAAAARFS